MSAAAIDAPAQSAADYSQAASRPPATTGQQQQQQQREQREQAAPAPAHAAPPHHSWLPNEHILHGEISLAGSRYGSLNQDFLVRT